MVVNDVGQAWLRNVKKVVSQLEVVQEKICEDGRQRSHFTAARSRRIVSVCAFVLHLATPFAVAIDL